jgi:hypothetical protein
MHRFRGRRRFAVAQRRQNVAKPEDRSGERMPRVIEGGAPGVSQSLQCTEALQRSLENIYCQKRRINCAYCIEQWPIEQVNKIIDILKIKRNNWFKLIKWMMKFHSFIKKI